MGKIRRFLGVGAGAAVGGLIACFATTLLGYVGIPYREDAAAWMAIVGSIHGAIVATFGWKYWVALGNDAGDLVDD